MLWFFIGHIFSTLLSLIRVSHLSENDKDLEIIILRHQLDVMVRKHKQPIRPNRAEKATLALLTARTLQKPHLSWISRENRCISDYWQCQVKLCLIPFEV